MLSAKPTCREALAWGWLALGALTALWSLAAMATSAFAVNPFDESLRLLQVVYAGRGLIPYVDYGFLYPPGYAWFYGKLLRLQEPESVIAAIAVVNLFLVVACAGQLMRLAPGSARLYGGTVLLILGGVIPLASGNVQDPHSLILVPIAVLLLAEVMMRGPSAPRLAALVGAAAVAAMFRWDWILFIAVLEACGAAVVWLAAIRLEPRHQSTLARRMSARLGWGALAALAGVIAAILVMAGYALATGTWAETRFFVFDLPMLTHPHLPGLPPMPIRENLQWLLDLVALILIALAARLACFSTRAKPRFVYFLEGGALLAPCVALLPYAFLSPDFAHFLPLSVLVMVTSLTALIMWPFGAPRWLLLIALAITAMPALYIALGKVVRSRGMPHLDIHLQQTHKLTAGCTDLFPPDARSLFLSGPFPVVYLMRPDLRPATPFISDEPSFQSSCEFGSHTALIRAPRPLVVVLDAKPASPTSNIVGTMPRCSNIETVMGNLPTAVLGTCRIDDDDYRVVVVR